MCPQDNLDIIMHKITNKQMIGENFKRLEVQAPNIARTAKPGQFVMVMVDEDSDRIPLAVVESDERRGVITLVFEEVGPVTKSLGEKQIGSFLFALTGPLGMPIEVKKVGTVVCIAEGANTAQILPICRSLKKAGNKVISIVGVKTKKKLTLESHLRSASYKLLVLTEDGSYEKRGMPINILGKVLKEEDVDLVYVFGSVELLRSVTAITKKEKIKTLVGLSPVMVDGLGLCGSCRVRVGDREVFACTDGPIFNGHDVDFDYLKARMA
ncbi:MAG: sulfide/dihydroorotate dehydrogenase-like FAD/NAD-binding protein [Candidatus Omnitrophota bacterium]